MIRGLFGSRLQSLGTNKASLSVVKKLWEIIAAEEKGMLKLYTLILEAIKFLEGLFNKLDIRLPRWKSSPVMNVEEIISLRNQVEDFWKMMVNQKNLVEKDIKTNDKRKNKVAQHKPNKTTPTKKNSFHSRKRAATPEMIKESGLFRSVKVDETEVQII